MAETTRTKASDDKTTKAAEEKATAGVTSNDDKVVSEPGTEETGRTVGEVSGAPRPTQTKANPEGDMTKSTGKVGDDEVIHAQEHVLGDDPRRIQAQEGGYHDSLSGRPVDENGTFTDTQTKGSEGPVPPHRIVANNWPQDREAINDPAKREGNTASK